MHDFEARSKYELSVEKDDLLDVIEDSQSWWRVRNTYGWFLLLLLAVLSSVFPWGFCYFVVHKPHEGGRTVGDISKQNW